MEIVTITEENFEAIIEENAIVFLDFWAPWCNPCLSFSKIFQMVAGERPEILFGQVNIDEESGLRKDFQITSIPQLIVIKNGVAILSQSGLISQNALKKLAAQALSVVV